MRRYLCVRGLSLLGFYTLPLSITFTLLALGLNTQELTIASTARTATLVLALPLSGIVADKYPPRVILSLGHVVAALPLIVASAFIWKEASSVLHLSLFFASTGSRRPRCSRPSWLFSPVWLTTTS